MKLTKTMLRNTFNSAKENNEPYVILTAKENGFTKVVLIPNKEFDSALSFYDENLNEVLMLGKSRITGLTFGDLEAVNDLI